MHDITEKFLTILVFTGIFLPVRLFFYTYVSEFWLGSFGLMTGIMIALIYFSSKGRLGKIGYIVNRQVLRYSRGRYGKLSMVIIIFFVYIYGNVIYGIEYAREDVREQFLTAFEEAGVTDLQTLSEESENLTWETSQTIDSTLFALLIIFLPNSVGHAFFSIINDWSDGWMIHFTTVFLIEELEVLGLMIYFRYFKKGNINNVPLR